MNLAYKVPGSTRIVDKDTGCVCYLYSDERMVRTAEGPKKRMVYGIQGWTANEKQKKPALWYNYPTEEKRDAKVAEFFAGHKAHKEAVAKRRADRLQTSKLEVGTILTGSWGYDQTNVEYWQVIEKVGTKKVKVQKVRMIYTEQKGPHGDKVIPDIGNTYGEEVLKLVQHGNRLSFTCFSLSPWGGKPAYQTDSMYGH